VKAGNTYDSAHVFVAHAKANPQSGLPPLGLDTGRVYRGEGGAVVARDLETPPGVETSTRLALQTATPFNLTETIRYGNLLRSALKEKGACARVRTEVLMAEDVPLVRSRT
jgi:hypothetical protein